MSLRQGCGVCTVEAVSEWHRDWTTADLSCFQSWNLCTSLYVIATVLRDSLGIASMVLPWDVDFWRPKWF